MAEEELTFGFNEAELAANRDGYMLPSQKQRLRESLDKRFTFLIFVSVLMGFSSYFGIGQLSSGNVFAVMIGVGLLGLHLWVVYQAYLNYQVTKADMTKNDILMTEGIIRLTLKFPPYEERGVLHINGLKFDVSQETLLKLWNGCYYCVYYTPNTKRLLSFERIPTNTLSEFDAELGKKFHFDAETLAANRDSKFTEAQRTRLKYHPLREFWSSLGYSAIVWLPILIIALSIGGAGFGCLSLFVGFIWFSVIALTVLTWNDARTDLRLNRVSSIIGSVSWYENRYGAKLLIKGMPFDLSRKDYLLFHHGERYQIFYAQQAKQILSVERVVQ
jgi:hypothetical protein